MWKTLLKCGKVLVFDVFRIARIETGIKKTDSAVQIATGSFEWAISAVNGGGAVGVCQGA